jgi:1-phosphatidylinositol-3-phosphate 5-kinase
MFCSPGQVTAYYAPQFAELRRRCCDGGEAAFLASLSRCRPWQAQGGKSRSYFAKTADDRFIVKQLSGPEKKSFLALGPDYFKYLFESFRKRQPTCLAKILGVYTVCTARTCRH